MAAAVRAVQHGFVALRVLSPGFAWTLVAVLALITVAVAVVSRSGQPAPAVHVWHAHVLPYYHPVPQPVPSR